jgi:hypothetical protein
MGYLIEQPQLDIKKLTVIIPQADVQLMDSAAAFTLIDPGFQYIVAPIACFLQIEANQTTAYTGFNHVHLSTSETYTVGAICGTYSINASATNNLESGGNAYGMLLNFQASPNRFGGLLILKKCQIFFDTLPTAGDGDMKVTLFYNILTI